jgi:hypothetical protein
LNSTAHSSRFDVHSGFSRDDEWGYRALEPSRCCISSISLVLLNTGIEHGGSRDVSNAAESDSDSDEENLKAKTTTGDAKVTLDEQQMNTAQKLLLFWRKPAVRAFETCLWSLSLTLRPQRKCWWDGVEVDIPVGGDSKEHAKIKVWARRVWTLELSLVRLLGRLQLRVRH